MVARAIERQNCRMIAKLFGSKLSTLRNSEKITQESLASKAGLGVRFIQDLEAGEKQPTITTVFRLAKALNASPSDLLDEIFKSWAASISIEGKSLDS